MKEFSVSNGMSRSVFENKYSRKKEDGTYQSWSERIEEVIDGNFSLNGEFTCLDRTHNDYFRSMELAKAGVIVSSGRHLQHGDSRQSKRSGEVFVNCSTAMFSFIEFWLLLKGSGVGRCYDSDICRVNWDHMPNVRLVINGPDHDGNGGHPDYEPWMETVAEAEKKYDSESEAVRWFRVADSAEGWSKIIQIIETAAWQEKHRDKLYVFDFSDVRCKGTPIAGQQGRPASGPAPLMRAINQVCSIKGAGMKPWKQAMYIDHYLASCILVGGIRSSSRIAVKSWRDRDVLDFIDIKRGGFLYTANNSVGVDDEFWDQASNPAPSHGRRVFQAMVSAAYFDRTGEPASLNMDRMSWNSDNLDSVTSATLFNEDMVVSLDLHPKTMEMMSSMLTIAKKKKYPYIVNPCAEIVLSIWGGYCTVGDVCLANAETLDDAVDGVRLMAQFLIRANTMKYLYNAEVKRTNRIGVSIIGIHEFAYKHFGYTFRDLIKETKSAPFWNFIKKLKEAVEEESRVFSLSIGMVPPHTATTIKPAGTTAKVMSCTEGAHLPSYDYYMRWVQYSFDSSSLEEVKAMGYPFKDISHAYPGKIIVGFPTKMPIIEVMGDDVVLAGEVSMVDQYRWLELLEKYWLGEKTNNQISYTMKYNPKKLKFDDFMRHVLENQRKVRACAVMAQEDTSAYAYLPEERISKEEYELAMSKIVSVQEKEEYDEKTLVCAGGACPIEFNTNQTA